MVLTSLFFRQCRPDLDSVFYGYGVASVCTVFFFPGKLVTSRLTKETLTCLSPDRPPNEFIPPVQEPYQYIIFRASEVKDLAVDEPVPQRSVHDDPAVLGVSSCLPLSPRLLYDESNSDVKKQFPESA